MLRASPKVVSPSFFIIFIFFCVSLTPITHNISLYFLSHISGLVLFNALAP